MKKTKSYFGKMSETIPRFQQVRGMKRERTVDVAGDQKNEMDRVWKTQKKKTMRLHIVEIHYSQNHIWLFGLNDDWVIGSKEARTVTVKVPFEQHLVYNGPLDDSVLQNHRTITRIEYDQYKKMCMYDGNRSFPMRRIYFDFAMKKKSLVTFLTQDGVGKVYNDRIDPVVQFVHETGAQFFRVAEVDISRTVSKRDQETINDVEYVCRTNQVRGLNGPDSFPKSILRVCDFDIETLNLDPNPTGEMPDPESNQVITVCVSMHYMGDTKNVKRFALILDPNTNPGAKEQIVSYLEKKDSWGVKEFVDEGKIPGNVLTYGDEKKLLSAAKNLIMANDVIVGWNSIAFDLNYLFVRGQVHREPRLTYYSKFKNRVCEQKNNVKQGISYVLTPGVVQMDAQKACQIQTHGKLQSYKLTEVAQKTIGKRKKDLPWQYIEPCFREGPIGRAKVADYCIWDVDLVTLLCEKQDYFSSMTALSTMCSVDMTQILMRGQQLRVFQVLTLEILKQKIVMNRDDLDQSLKGYNPRPTEKRDESLQGIEEISTFYEKKRLDDETEQKVLKHLVAKKSTSSRSTNARTKKYDGGYVIKPNPGRYKNVTVMDYNALYPSIIIAYNLCFRNLVTDQEKARRLIADGRDVYVMNSQKDAYCAFVMDAKDTLFPHVLKKLLKERTRVKGLKKEALKAKNIKAAKIYDALQLAIKVVCNSCYGFVGAKAEQGYFPCLPIAVTITYIGQQLIRTLEKHIPVQYPSLKVVYGDTDSVFVKFPDEMKPQEIIPFAEKVVDELNQLPMHRNYLMLEFESLFINILLCAKKCYASGKYVGENQPLEYYPKGLSAIRRDNCNWARKIMNDFLISLVVKPKSIDELMEELRQNMEKIDSSDLFDFSITCGVSKEYKNDNLIQCKVIDEIRTRLKCHEAVKVGDRIRYVVRSGVKSKKYSDWGIQYEYAAQIGAKPHFEHYLEKVKKPLETIVHILGQSYVRKFTQNFNKLKGRLIRKRTNTMSIANFCVRR